MVNTGSGVGVGVALSSWVVGWQVIVVNTGDGVRGCIINAGSEGHH